VAVSSDNLAVLSAAADTIKLWNRWAQQCHTLWQLSSLLLSVICWFSGENELYSPGISICQSNVIGLLLSFTKYNNNTYGHFLTDFEKRRRFSIRWYVFSLFYSIWSLIEWHVHNVCMLYISTYSVLPQKTLLFNYSV
jgi:hypothetical protein